MINSVQAIILAGGVGSRLAPLTADRAKPAVPFGGKYRIIDFSLSNCLHSGIRRILVLTQYKSHSLQKHLRDAWSIFNPELGEYITTVPPQMRKGKNLYLGTADAIYQNTYLLERSDAEYIVILAGDHIYRMDYASMISQHIESSAELTVACMKVPLQEAKSFGVMSINQEQKIVSFEEKPQQPSPMPGDSDHALVSMGIYVFNKSKLMQSLHEDNELTDSSHDFGHDIIPRLVKQGNAYAYSFGGVSGRVSRDNYWRDVGTIDAYYQANMDLLRNEPPLDLYQEDWPIRTYSGQVPPARTIPSKNGTEGIFINSILGGGSVISGGNVQGSVLFDNVRVAEDAVVEESILFSGVSVGKSCVLRRCIIEKGVVVPAKTEIGVNADNDKRKFPISSEGIVVVARDHEF